MNVDLVTCEKNVEIRIAAQVIQLLRWAAEGSASGRACATRFFPFPLSSQAWRPSTPPDNQEGGFRAQHARHTRADAPPRDRVAGAYPGFPLARVSWRATWRRHRPCSRRSIPHHTPKARDDRRARGWECSASATRRTRPRSTHPHPRSANPPFWFSAGAERRHHRRARTTTHTTPSSRRVAYMARLSRDPRCARCSAHLKPRHGGRGRRVALCASASSKKSKGLVS